MNTTTTTEDDTTNANNDEREIFEEWVEATTKTSMALDPKQYVPEFWKNGTRPDGRFFSQARRTTIVKGVLKQHTIGSALVKFVTPPPPPPSSSSNDEEGRTTATAEAAATETTSQVLAGITCQIGQPASGTDRHDCGDILLTCNYNNHMEQQQQHHNYNQQHQQNVSVIESWLQRLVNQVMNVKQLCIVPGQAAFRLCITVQILQYDGNLQDACCLAVFSALNDTVLPIITVPQHKGGKVWIVPVASLAEVEKQQQKIQKSKSLSLLRIPVSLTMASWLERQKEQNQPHWIVDPTQEEEMAADGNITVVVDALSRNEILLLESKGNVPVSKTNLALAVKMAEGRAQELLSFL